MHSPCLTPLLKKGYNTFYSAVPQRTGKDWFLTMSETKNPDAGRNFLGTQPIGKLLWKLAVPSVVAQLVNLAYNMVDRVYIGHISGIGSLALTGVGVSFPIIILISAFASLVGMGAAPKASICMGQQDDETAERILGSSTVFLTAIGLVLTVVLSLFARPLLMRFGASENTIGYAMDYLSIYLYGTIAVQLALGLNAFITAQGFTTTSMLSVLIGAGLNIVLDPLFIFVFGMGVRGAALATILSQAVSTVWVVAFLCGKRTRLKLHKKNLCIDWKVLAPCLALGVSPFIMQATEGIISVCFNSSLLRYGGDVAVGAMTILTTLMQLSMMPLSGLTQGAQPITGYNYGAGNADRVQASFKLLLRVCFAYSMGFWLLLNIFPAFFVHLFNSDDAALLAYTIPALRRYFAATGLFGIQIACQQTFIAIGNAKTSLFLALLRKVFLLIPLIYILPLFLPDKAAAVYLAEPVADALAVATTSVLFSIQFKQAMQRLRAQNSTLPKEIEE